MHRLHLIHNKGFRWTKTANGFSKGALYSPDGRFYGSRHTHEYFNDAVTVAALEDLVVNANGMFSVVCVYNELIVLTVDHIRMFPLFYAKKDGKYIVSDDALFLAKECDLHEKDELAEAEFLASGYVTGSKTLIKGVFQVQSGELLVLGANDIRPISYYSYATSEPYIHNYSKLRNSAIEILHIAFNRFTESLQGRTAVLALSGGYDSRLIAAMLKLAGCDNTICFTYGRAGNAESAVSEQVAKKLGFKWYNIIYNEALINGYLDDEGFREYYTFSANTTSMFFMQEYFAVRELKKRGLIPDDAVFVSGHSGDFLAGSQLTKYYISENAGISELTESLYNGKFNMLHPAKEMQTKIKNEIRKFLEYGIGKGCIGYSVYEDWDLKEKLSKFIANSVNVYGYFGYEWRLPFWDIDLTDFFRDIPYEFKMNKALYDDILIQEFFEPAGLTFEKELQPSAGEIRSRNFKNAVKSILPGNIRQKLLQRTDNICYHEITSYMLKDLEKRGIHARIHGNTYNSVIVQWYVSKVNTSFAI